MFHHAMREEYLKPTPLKPYMTYADHLVWPIHVPRRCEPLITPHLSLWGSSRTRATFPTHKKNHNPHPQGERGQGVNMGTLHCGGVGGVPAKPGSYIYISMYNNVQYVLWPIFRFQESYLLVSTWSTSYLKNAKIDGAPPSNPDIFPRKPWWEIESPHISQSFFKAFLAIHSICLIDDKPRWESCCPMIFLMQQHLPRTSEFVL